jgi:hypothetical protein
MRKIAAFFLVFGVFLTGFLASTALRQYTGFDLAEFLEPQEGPPPVVFPEIQSSVIEKDTFLETVALNEVSQFDLLYEKRQAELRDIIARGYQPGEEMLPTGIFAQVELIQGKLDQLSKLKTHSEVQASVRQALGRAYQLLKETYDFEVEFLKKYSAESQNIGFITSNIFEISARDQRSGFQYLSALLAYRRILTETIRDDVSLENNQARMRDLAALNSLVEKYRSLLNVPKEIT